MSLSSTLPFLQFSRSNPPVFLFGSGRGGTSWLAEVLSKAGGVRYIFEPFDSRKVPLLKGYPLRIYRRHDEEDPRLRDRIEVLLQGRFRCQWTDRFTSGHLHRHRLIKAIRANFLVAWIRRHFPSARLIFLLRHPIPTSLSKTRLGWDLHIEELLNQEALMEDHFGAVAREMEGWKADLAGHLHFWCLENLVPLRILPPGSVEVVFYEKLITSPKEQLEYICDAAGLRLRKRMLAQVATPSQLVAKDSAILRRESLLEAWKSRLSEEEQTTAMRILRRFGWDTIYGLDAHPNAEAFEAFWKAQYERGNSGLPIVNVPRV